MIVSFKDQATDNIFNGVSSRQARKACPQNLWRVTRRKLDQLDSVIRIDELLIPPGNRLETLTGNRMGEWSIRINQKYRICFKWTDYGPANVEVTDYH